MRTTSSRVCLAADMPSQTARLGPCVAQKKRYSPAGRGRVVVAIKGHLASNSAASRPDFTTDSSDHDGSGTGVESSPSAFDLLPS